MAIMNTVPRLATPPGQSFFLLGPRGSGKSTWLRMAYPDAHVVNLLREELYQRYLRAPQQFAAELRAVPAERWIVVDEIQRLPNLLNEAHRLIEEEKRRFCLCASSARKLRQAGTNLLAGRALKRTMHPFVPSELGNAFDLEATLRNGLLPIVVASENPEETLKAYTQLYLKEEIQAEALVRNLPGFARFLPVAAVCHGQTINATNIAREAAVARTTVNGYLDILEETLLCFRLPAYEAKLRLRERKLPKWYWCDPGMVRAMKGTFGAPAPEERGALFEGLVAQTIRAYKDYANLCDEWFYWAPVASRETEVDFLLRKGTRLAAIEVKSGAHFQESWGKGLRALGNLPGLCRRVVVTPTAPRMVTADRIEVVGFADFENWLATNQFWA